MSLFLSITNVRNITVYFLFRHLKSNLKKNFYNKVIIVRMVLSVTKLKGTFILYKRFDHLVYLVTKYNLKLYILLLQWLLWVQ